MPKKTVVKTPKLSAPNRGHKVSKSGRITSVELANILGLSTTTVSFVLNGRAEEKKIAAKTAQRVMQAAQKYNYQPDPFARSLLKQRSGAIGVVLGNFKMDFAESVMQGMRRVLDETDRFPLVSTHNFDPALNRKELLSSLARRDEGVIAFPLPGCNEVYTQLSEAGMPVILFGEVISGLEHFNHVIWEVESAARAAVEHLLAVKRRKIAYLGVDYPGLGNALRLQAYREVLVEHGIPYRRDRVVMPPPDLEPEQICQRAVEKLFTSARNKPDAIFVVNDGVALHLLELLRHRGIRVPEDVAVIGMQDLPLSGHPAIGLSTVREPVRRMAEQAIRALIDLIEARARPPIKLSVNSSTVIARRSTIGSSGSIQGS